MRQPIAAGSPAVTLPRTGGLPAFRIISDRFQFTGNKWDFVPDQSRCIRFRMPDSEGFSIQEKFDRRAGGKPRGIRRGKIRTEEEGKIQAAGGGRIEAATEAAATGRLCDGQDSGTRGGILRGEGFQNGVC